MTVVAVDRLTFEEFSRLPEEDVSYELVNGLQVPLMSPKMAHSRVQTKLAGRIDNYLGDDFEGFFGTELDFPTLPFHGRRGDIVYYAAGHITEEDWERGYPLLPPDLVIEVVSPGENARDYTEKRQEYPQIGIPNYWIFDGPRRTLDLLVLGESGEYELERRLLPSDTLTSSLFPELCIRLAPLFRRE